MFKNLAEKYWKSIGKTAVSCVREVDNFRFTHSIYRGVLGFTQSFHRPIQQLIHSGFVAFNTVEDRLYTLSTEPNTTITFYK